VGNRVETFWSSCKWPVGVGCLLSLSMTILYADPNGSASAASHSSWKHLALLALIAFLFPLAPGFRVLCFSGTCAGPLGNLFSRCLSCSSTMVLVFARYHLSWLSP